MLNFPRTFLLLSIFLLFLPAACGRTVGEDDLAASHADFVAEEPADRETTEPVDLTPEQKYPGEPGSTAAFALERQSFYDQPFPCNTRIRADGSVNFEDFPNPYGLGLIEDYLKLAAARLDGFSNNGSMYFRFDQPLDVMSFPTVYETADLSSPLLLVNVTPESEFYGTLIPLESWYWDRAAPTEGYFLEPYLIAMRPLGGFPLRPGETYACVVTRAVVDQLDRHVGQSEIVKNALSDDVTAPLRAMFEPLRTWLAQTPELSVADVAVATIFTAQNPVDEMIRAAAWVQEEAEIVVSGPVESKPTGNPYELYEGHYLAPNFQTGEPPYDSGGEIVFNQDGTPKVQWTEEITFSLTIPLGQPTPPGGWPLVMYSHGTGGSHSGFTKSVATKYVKKGIAVIAIDQPLHGDRYHGPPIDIEFYSFNFTNPWAARSLFRQAALDYVSLTKFVKEFSFSAAGKTVSFNGDRLGYFGHSQGGLTGALLVAVEDSLKASVLSGAGGGLAYTILLRKELDSGTYFDIKAALEAALKLEYEDELTLFHPIISLAQTLVEATDPLNYSPLYFYPRVMENPANVLITEGVLDPYTPAVTTENLAIAGGIPPMSPIANDHPGFIMGGLEAAKLPVSGNMVTPDGKTATALLAQYDDHGHFAAFDSPELETIYLNFLSSALLSPPAVLSP